MPPLCLYYAKPGDLTPATVPRLQSLGFSGALVPLPDLFTPAWDPTRVLAAAREARDLVGTGTLWLVLGTTNKSGAVRHTLWPWEDDGAWEEGRLRLRHCADLAAQVGAGLAFDAEFYPSDGSTSQRGGWERGDPRAIRQRGKALQAVCSRVPLAVDAIDSLMTGTELGGEPVCPAYVPFWRAALRGHPRPHVFACDGFYRRDLEPPTLTRSLRERWGAGLTVWHGWMPRPTDGPAWLRGWVKRSGGGFVFSEVPGWLRLEGREQGVVGKALQR